jgi:hypothetical protein
LINVPPSASKRSPSRSTDPRGRKRAASVGESRSKPALPPKIVWQHQLGETVQFSFGYFAMGVCFDP